MMTRAVRFLIHTVISGISTLEHGKTEAEKNMDMMKPVMTLCV